MGIIIKLKKRQEKARKLENLASIGEYSKVVDLLSKEIKKRNPGSYDFVNFRILKIDLPKKDYEYLLEIANSNKPKLYALPFYHSMKMALEMKINE